jgi:hypothetical protein
LEVVRCILFARAGWKMNKEMSPSDPAMLTCWKDIAHYMGKGVRTVQRWEQEFGLPVRRPNGTQHKAAVTAIPRELDEWLESSWSVRAKNGDQRRRPAPIADNINRARLLREAHQSLVHEISTTLHALVQSCGRLTQDDEP